VRQRRTEIKGEFNSMVGDKGHWEGRGEVIGKEEKRE